MPDHIKKVLAERISRRFRVTLAYALLVVELHQALSAEARR